jgi:CHAT domain-containing protein
MRDTSGGLLRIWWIGTGLGSWMPFNAAGRYTRGSTDNTISEAISSYTPSIKALEYAQHRAKLIGNTKGSLLIATMRTTPKAPGTDAPKFSALHSVTEEKSKVTDIANGRMPVQTLDLPSVDLVVDGLRGCSIAHFACHGSTERADPSNSGLVLQKQGERQEAGQDRLTVHKISELSLTHARLAYLSACSTAENMAVRLADEVIHVVSGFQVAGFPHVVGCLWPSNDRVCLQIASGFYGSLLQRGVTGWDGRDVASAPREAVMAV